MRNVQVILVKESVQSSPPVEACAIVLDIIFATSSMTAAFEAGVSRIYPALDFDEATRVAQTLPADGWLLAGEHYAQAFEGFVSFEPLALAQPQVKGKDLVYATTNGTVALRRSQHFRKVYAASLRNGPAVARHFLAETAGRGDIVIVCSGTLGRFSLEDFYGAGYLVQCLRAFADEPLAFDDVALAAELAFAQSKPLEVLRHCRLGRMMTERGMADSLAHASQLDASAVVAVYEGGWLRDVSHAAHVDATRLPVSGPAGARL